MVNQIIFSSILQTWYVELRISRSISESPLEFEITRVDCIDPLKPYFYIIKLGFSGVYIIFLISAQNIDCEYTLELPRRGGSNEYPQSMFWAEMWKISEFLSENFQYFGGEIFYIFEKVCFRNGISQQCSSHLSFTIDHFYSLSVDAEADFYNDACRMIGTFVQEATHIAVSTWMGDHLWIRWPPCLTSLTSRKHA